MSFFPKDLRSTLKQEVLEMLFHNLSSGLIGAFLIVTIIFLNLLYTNASGPILTQPLLKGWYVAMIAVLILRTILLYWHKHSKRDSRTLKLKYQTFFISSLLTSIGFALIASILMPNDIRNQALILILVSGVVAGAMQSLSASFLNNITYGFLILISTLLWQLHQIYLGNFLYIGIFSAMFIFCIFSLLVAKRNYQMQMTNIKLRYEISIANISLEQFATRDMLTDLFNRHYLNDFLDMEILRAKRKRTHIAVCMIDIDHFKHFNDTYGHDVGDEVIKKVGNFLKSIIRGSDVVCRYGGDEFVLVLTETNRETAKQRIQECLDESKHLFATLPNDAKEKIHLSIGLATFPEDGNTRPELIKVADQAMYTHKNGNRQHGEKL